MKRWKLTIEYDGSNYYGWQRQDGDISIQQAVEEAIQKFCGQEIRIQGAGRTDARVHAKGQVAHFDLDYGDREMNGFELAKAINFHLKPQPIAISHAEIVGEDFHARFSAKNKLYTYRIVNRGATIALDQSRVWHKKKKLDIEAMIKAAKYLEGTHDFTTFRGTRCQAKSPVRTLTRLEIETKDYDDHEGKEILIHAESKGFLHHQVRNMVGSLSLVGEGKWTPEDLKPALEAKDRKAGGPTAPSQGLYLIRIDY
jgi:tRNA pseudouridine38-40 synthase